MYGVRCIVQSAATAMSSTVPADVIRAYIRTLRECQDKTQAEVAGAMGMPYRTYVDWELGETKKLDGALALRALVFLRATRQHIELLVQPGMTEEKARRMAEELAAQLAALPYDQAEQRRQQALAIIEELLADPQKLDRWIGYGDRLKEEA